jgi:MFS family permease
MGNGPQRLFGRDFLLLWQGQLVSQLGNQAFLVATMSWTLEATGSPALMGLLLMASTLPAVVFGPIAGAVADRHSRRGLIVAADLLRGLGHLVLAGVLVAAPEATGLIVPVLVAMGFASGILGALLTPALAAAVPDLVPAHRLAAANSLHHMSTQTAALVGQAAGGVAYAWAGAAGLVLFDGLTFVVSAAFAALARVPSPASRPEGARQDRAAAYLGDVREGLRWLWARPALRSLVLVFAAVNFLFTPVFVLLPVYVKDVLVRGTEWYGFLLAAAGGGAMAGAALAALLPAGRKAVVVSLLGIGACTLLLGARLSSPLALAALAVVGLFSGILNVKVMTMLQEATPAELRGRVLAVTVAVAGAAVPAGLGLGGLAGGVLRSALPLVLAACGAGIVAVAAVFAIRGTRERAVAAP